MRYRDKIGRRCLEIAFILTIFILPTKTFAEINLDAYARQEKTEHKVFAAQTSEQITRSTVPQSTAAQSKKPAVTIKKPEAGNRKAKNATRLSKAASNEPTASLEEKKEQALSLIEGVLLRTDKIAPIEYKILTEVEAGTLLWQFDRERSISIFKNAVKAMRQLLDEKKQSTTRETFSQSKEQRLWFLALRKIASVKPELLQQLLLDNSQSDGFREATQKEWTEEARALMSVASGQIEKNPQLAARLAQQSLALGMSDWIGFLNRLGKRDNGEAELLAINLMDKLKDSSINALVLRNLVIFVFAPDRSLNIKEHFFQSVAIRLRRDVRPDTPAQDLEDDLNVARGMSKLAATHAPNRQQDFDNLSFAIEMLFKERSAPLPGSPVRRELDISALNPATPDDTQNIADVLPRVAAIRDSKARDRAYQKLAAKASSNADMGLAEEILSKINDEATRKETTLLIYTPLIRKSINESDWSQAQKQATKIIDPLARSLVFDRIAQAMAGPEQDKFSMIDVYGAALTRLDREEPSEKVARAYMLLARPLYSLDAERGLEAIRSSIYVLNKLTNKEDSLQESAIEPAIQVWIRYTDPSLTVEEILNPVDMVSTTFKQIAKRDLDNALSLALRINNLGMHSLAQLAISRALLDEPNKQLSSSRRKGL